MALGEPIRVRMLCCLTFLVKVKSKVSSLWGCYPIPPSPPLAEFVVLVLLRLGAAFCSCLGDGESLAGLLVVGRMEFPHEPVVGSCSGIVLPLRPC